MLSVRRIRSGEADLFKKLRLQALKESPDAFGSSYEETEQRSAESWVNQVESSAQGSDRATVIAFQDDLPAGLAALYRMDNTPHMGELLQVWVSPEVRGQGVAGALIDNLFDWASRNNFKTIVAGIISGNEQAVHFYEKHGFSAAEGISVGCPAGSLVLKKEIK
ncbi:MAG: GNAT family N-acetyltransferase [Candidatus Marinimicrobia bacterium]|nr:GNAT family N-acetyltransferase [Candidatus Neomarinimicrobiota bacterium]